MRSSALTACAVLLIIAMGPGQVEAGPANVTSATVGYLYVGSSGIQVLAQDTGGHLKVVSAAAGGAAIGMAMTHERNGLNLYALAPDGPGELYGIYHYMVNQSKCSAPSTRVRQEDLKIRA